MRCKLQFDIFSSRQELQFEMFSLINISVSVHLLIYLSTPKLLNSPTPSFLEVILEIDIGLVILFLFKLLGQEKDIMSLFIRPSLGPKASIASSDQVLEVCASSRFLKYVLPLLLPGPVLWKP